jgi:hypothetical protein
MEVKEKVKYFNKRFLTLINNIPHASNPVEDVSIEIYTSSLPISMETFVKRDENNSLEATFKEAIKVEKDMLGLKFNLGFEASKDKIGTKNKVFITKTP